MNHSQIERRVVVITGGSDGIGAAAAKALARRGDRVILIGRSPAKTSAVAAETGAESHVADDAALAKLLWDKSAAICAFNLSISIMPDGQPIP
jgi:NAD(P)-dependent dehydrogenase (short-subunit alcohol dehydrogenase family)